MHHSVETRAPNSLILVMDRGFGLIPEKIEGLIAATPSCVAVATLSEHDGTTRITLTDVPPEDAACELVFDGLLETPGRNVAVCSVMDEVILDAPVGQDRTMVQIWVNDRAEPNDIRIMITTPDLGDPDST